MSNGVFFRMKRRNGPVCQRHPVAAAGLVGFTLAELLIVILLIGILAAIALPAYQDYTIRSQVAESLNLVAPVKTAVAQVYSRSAQWPANLDAAGVRGTAYGKYVEQIYLRRGTIFIQYGGASKANVSGRLLSIRPTLTPTGSINWSCGYHPEVGFDPPTGPAAPHGTTINPKYLPYTCRK